MIAPHLASREREVLTLLIRGLAITQIAKRLDMSELTAKTYVANLYEKFGAGNRAQAVMAAYRLGFTDGDDGGALVPSRPKPPVPPPAAVALSCVTPPVIEDLCRSDATADGLAVQTQPHLDPEPAQDRL